MNDDNVMRFPKARTSQLSGAVTSRHPAGVKAAAPLCDERANGGETGISPAAPLPTHPLFELANTAVHVARDAASGEFPERVANAAQAINRELLIIAVHEHDVSLFRAVSLLAINLSEVSERDSDRSAHWMLTLPHNMLLVRDLLALTKLKAGL